MIRAVFGLALTMALLAVGQSSAATHGPGTTATKLKLWDEANETWLVSATGAAADLNRRFPNVN